MNTELWLKIQAFDFDRPMSEYNFSTRLAKENYWTKNFTATAIQEYKKFMYLAGTSDMMVSPSGVVDTVWHQHLVFTNSYNEICSILGKTIQHIPSTHNKVEAGKFKQAKERTRKLYSESFGEMPREIWEYPTMYDCLELPKAKWKIRTFILFGLLALAALFVPAYYFLRPIYVNLDSFTFLSIYAGLAVGSLVALSFYNQYSLKQMVRRFRLEAFIYKLSPSELLYLHGYSLDSVITGLINDMTKAGKIKVDAKNQLEKVEGATAANLEEHQVLDALESGPTHFHPLTEKLSGKPLFKNVMNCMDAFQKYFTKSKAFGNLFYLNFGILGAVFLLGFTRWAIGMMRDKPVGLIGLILFVFFVIIAFRLFSLPGMMAHTIVPGFYREQLIPAGRHAGQSADWQYFLAGSAVLMPALIPATRRQTDSSSSSSTDSSSSSSDSSCGSSCGGCGGGD
jgi:uncharacterized protein (TIGR04222 family)